MKRDWLIAVLGPLAWIGTHIAAWLEAPQHTVLLGAVEIVALVIAIGALIASGRRLFGLQRENAPEQVRFVPRVGAVLSALSIVLIAGFALMRLTMPS